MISKLRGKIIILTAPSGSGKTTIANFLLNRFNQLSFSVSATTRQARENEKNGINYFYLSNAEFQSAINDNKFFEYQEVYPNLFYGTLYQELDRIWDEHKIALFDIDVKGAHIIESNFKENILSIYIKTSSLDVLKQRLLLRGTESPESLNKRLLKAEEELEYAKYFDYVVTNDNLKLAEKVISLLIEDFILEPLK